MFDTFRHAWGVGGQQYLTRDGENHLASISAGVSESYVYNANSVRVKKDQASHSVDNLYEVMRGGCSGQTPAGATNWQVYNSSGIYLDVDTTGCGLTSTPRYITSIGGSGNHFAVTGVTAIYAATATGFRVYVRYANDAPISPAQANSYGWQINWTALPTTKNQVETKYYSFAGQRIAMKRDGILTYLHSDHLGSTVLETNTSGQIVADQRYYAYGKQRDTGPVSTEHQFTGQKQDGSGLVYMNARYYDPVLGQFISPDTLVADPGVLMDYNRYGYARGNPMRFNDPSGHCATLSSGRTDENDAECWTLARTIAAMWGDTDYWQERFGDVSVWNDSIAPSGATVEFFAGELDMFLNSDDGRTWLNDNPVWIAPEQDFGDYSSFNFSWFVIDGSLVVDDFGNAFFRISPSLSSPGISVTRGDVLVTNDPNATIVTVLKGEAEVTDIDEMGLSRAEKRQLMQQLMVGRSQVASVGARLFAFGASQANGVITVEGGMGGWNPGLSVAPYSRTWQLLP